jgi:hypothetical protein
MDREYLGQELTRCTDRLGTKGGSGRNFFMMCFICDASKRPLLCVYFGNPTIAVRHYKYYSFLLRDLHLRRRLTSPCISRARSTCWRWECHAWAANERGVDLARCHAANAEGALNTTTNTAPPAHQHTSDAALLPVACLEHQPLEQQCFHPQYCRDKTKDLDMAQESGMFSVRRPREVSLPSVAPSHSTP